MSLPGVDYRLATPEDVPAIARRLKRFYAKVGGVYRIPYDHESCLETVAHTVKDGICVVGPSSCAGARLCPYPFNYRVIVAMVVFWSFARSREIAILDVLMATCQSLGVHAVNVASHFPDHTIGRRYRKKGFYPTETQWLASLKSLAIPGQTGKESNCET